MKFFLATFLVAYFVASAQADTPIPLGFYITSRCGDTIRFITTQLYPTYQELGQYLSVDFIPWAKTKRLEDGSLSCQFGATDCAANRLQSCALARLTKDADKVEYINCEFSTLNSVSQNYTCVTQVGLKAADVKACVDSNEGDLLQAEAERKTGLITMIFVPTIVLNGTYDVAVQNAAFKDFRGFVCGLLKEDNIDVC